MRRLGIWMVVFGVLDFALPRFGYDLKWFEYLGESRDVLAGGLIVIGAALLIVASKRRKAAG